MSVCLAGLGPAASGKTTLLKTFIVEILYSYKDFVPILMPVIELVRVFKEQQPGTSVLVTYLQLHYANHCHLLMQKVLQLEESGLDEFSGIPGSMPAEESAAELADAQRSPAPCAGLDHRQPICVRAAGPTCSPMPKPELFANSAYP